MNDERFSELAMKAIARQATEAERSELDAVLANQPDRREEFERLKADSLLAREILPLVEAVGAAEAEFPGYARQRLQTKVRQVLRPNEGPAESESARVAFHGWRWLLGISAALAVVLLVVMPAIVGPGEVVVHVAVLDVGGMLRGSETNDLETIRAIWPSSSSTVFEQRGDLQGWREAHQGTSKDPVVQVLYDRAAAEITVNISGGQGATNRTFVVEDDLSETLREARAFVETVTSGR